MDPTLQLVLIIIASVAAFIFWCMVTYLIIRYAIFHGMRAHTRWIDGGKDATGTTRWG